MRGEERRERRGRGERRERGGRRERKKRERERERGREGGRRKEGGRERGITIIEFLHNVSRRRLLHGLDVCSVYRW
jgi:hypothetical protein